MREVEKNIGQVECTILKMVKNIFCTCVFFLQTSISFEDE